jgi:hypothetical protein
MDWFKISASKIENAIGKITDIGSDNSDAGYPKLSSVPVLPETMSSQDERTTIRNRLIADRDNANYVRGKSNLWPNSSPPKMKRVNNSNKIVSNKSKNTTSNVPKPVFSKLKKELEQERLAKNDKSTEQSVAKPELNKISSAVSETKSLPKFRFNIPQVTNGQDNLAEGKLKFKFVNVAANHGA